MRTKDHDQGKHHHLPAESDNAGENMMSDGASSTGLDELDDEIEREADEDVDSLGVNDEPQTP
jgi:hypothetical protein